MKINVEDNGHIILDSGLDKTKIGTDHLKKKEHLEKASQIFLKKRQAAIFTEIQPLFYDRAGLFWLWNHDTYCWERTDEVDLLNMISESTGMNVISPKNRTEIINSLKQYGRKKIPKPIKKTWIQFKSVIYDIETQEKWRASPDYFVTNPIPWRISGDSRTPKMDKVFAQWVGEDHVKTLHEILAYSLLPDYPIHRIFCFIGSGLNGKSKFLELLRKFVGEDNCCSTELDTLLNSRFEVTRLHKKLVCQMGETNFSEMNKTSLLKKLSGGDLIGFEYKRKDPFEEINYAKILIATNNLPATTDKTIGFYRRWMIIDFPNQFTEKKDILKEIPDEEFDNLATESLIILSDLLEKREFHKEGTIEERMKNYENKSNPMQEFINLNCDTSDVSVHMTKSQFSKKLNQWLSDNRHRAMSDFAINKFMKSHDFEEGLEYIDWWQNDNKIKKKARVWYGIKIKSQKKEDLEQLEQLEH